jgi:hypothetical protein
MSNADFFMQKQMQASISQMGKYEYMQSDKHALVLYIPTHALVFSPNLSNTSTSFSCSDICLIHAYTAT